MAHVLPRLHAWAVAACSTIHFHLSHEHNAWPCGKLHGRTMDHTPCLSMSRLLACVYWSCWMERYHPNYQGLSCKSIQIQLVRSSDIFCRLRSAMNQHMMDDRGHDQGLALQQDTSAGDCKRLLFFLPRKPRISSTLCCRCPFADS